MWREFTPLWMDLCSVNPQLLICGGYGLFLKQQWLGEPQQRDLPIIVNLNRWRDATPRVTKDIDLIVGVDLISSESQSQSFVSALNAHDYQVTETNPRWQFEKQLVGQRKIIVELHCSVPPPNTPQVQTDRFRVKHKPSLGEGGVHGRINPEAAGSDLHCIDFEFQNMNFRVPNPLTWCVMKLTAMDDRWQRANDPNKPEEQRNFSREQSFKHAQDICRIVALTARAERDALGAVKAFASTTVEFERACEITVNLSDESSPLVISLRRQWETEDFDNIRAFLSGWFSVPLSI